MVDIVDAGVAAGVVSGGIVAVANRFLFLEFRGMAYVVAFRASTCYDFGSQPYTVFIALEAALSESTSRLRLLDNSSVAPV